MNFYALAALANFITSAVLGIFVIYKSRKSKNVSFFVFCFFVAFWSISYFFWQIAKTSEDALFWCRVLMAFAIFIPVAYLQLVYSLVEILYKKKKFLIFSYFLFSLFLLADATPYFVNRIEPALNFQFWPMAGPFYSLFLIAWFFYVIYSTYLLYKKYKTSIGIIRYQIKYIIIGMIIGFAGGSTNYFLWYRIPIPPIANILVSVYVGTVAYAILRYRLMDIRVVFRRAVIYFFSSAFVYGMFYFVAWIYERSFGSIYSNNAYILGLIIAPLFVLFFMWMSEKIKKFANKYLFFSLYSSQETMAKLTDELTNLIDLNRIVDSIVNSIKNAMQLDRVGILLVDQSGEVIKYKIAKVIGFNENNGISLVQDNFLTRYLEKTQKPLVRDELNMIAKDLANLQERQKFFQLAENMKHIEASLCLPMIISSRLMGIIVLGSKISGDAYTSDDLALLNTLSKQAAIAVDNARLYREVQDFNKTLQQKVDEQTKEIREQKDDVEKAYQIEKQAHEELKRTDEAKTQFMAITQHHLRTPLTSIMGYLDLLLNNEFGKVSAKIKEVLEKLQISTKNEIKIINDILDVSGYQMGKETMEMEKGINVGDIIKEIADELDIQAKNKGIYLNFKKPENVFTISADKNKMKMALTNVVDNAIKYTNQGGVTISLEPADYKLVILVKDTGIGMSQKFIANLFNQTFHRGQEAQKLFAVGKGIGLFLAGKVIEAHNGKIWAESEGEGRGSTFHIELLIDK
jgi:signal transduction histidine kinase